MRSAEVGSKEVAASLLPAAVAPLLREQDAYSFWASIVGIQRPFVLCGGGDLFGQADCERLQPLSRRRATLGNAHCAREAFRKRQSNRLVIKFT